MTEHRRLKNDRKKLAAALDALAKGRAALSEFPRRGDPLWGPILGDMAVALVVLERRLDDAEDLMGGGA